jgi:lipopolysaccharide export system permease protein
MPLNILDRYIFNKFLSTFLFTLLIILMISVIIDFSEKIQIFLEEPITKREILLEYFPSFMLFISGMLWPLFTLIAVIFFTSRMAGNTEIMAILSAGIPFNRLMRPYLYAAGLLTLIHLVGSHFILPWGQKHLMRITYQYIDKNEDKGKTKDVHLFIAPQTKVYVGYFRKPDSTARDFRIEQYEGQKLVRLLKANNAAYQRKTGKWRLTEYQMRSFDGLKETFRFSNTEFIDTTLNLSPDDFVDFSGQQNMMTSPALLRFIALQKKRGAGNVRKYTLEWNRRNAEPFTILILTLIGVSLAARKVRGGIGLHLAMGIGIGAVYILFSKFVKVFAMGNNLPALLAAWIPNLFFLILAFFTLRGAQK